LSARPGFQLSGRNEVSGRFRSSQRSRISNPISTMSTLFVSGQDVSKVVRRVGADLLMDELILRLENAFREYNYESCHVPARSGFYYDQPYTGLIEWMPLMRRGDSVLMKMVGYHPENPSAHNLPTILSTLSLFNAHTGHMDALADGTLLTALRTGAASAIVSRWLAHPESRTLGLIGAGAQAMAQLHGLSRTFNLERTLVYDLDPAVSATFAGRIEALDVDMKSVEVAELDRVVAEADILCIATSVVTGSGPVFDSTMRTKPYLHINAVGSDLPGKIEVPVEFLRKSFVCPDFRMQAEKEGECQQLEDRYIGPELSAIARTPEKYQAHRNELSVFDSTGFALEDQVALEMILDYAKELGIGTAMQVECSSLDPHNPYEFLDSAPNRDSNEERVILNR